MVENHARILALKRELADAEIIPVVIVKFRELAQSDVPSSLFALGNDDASATGVTNTRRNCKYFHIKSFILTAA